MIKLVSVCSSDISHFVQWVIIHINISSSVGNEPTNAACTPSTASSAVNTPKRNEFCWRADSGPILCVYWVSFIFFQVSTELLEATEDNQRCWFHTI